MINAENGMKAEGGSSISQIRNFLVSAKKLMFELVFEMLKGEPKSFIVCVIELPPLLSPRICPAREATSRSRSAGNAPASLRHSCLIFL